MQPTERRPDVDIEEEIEMLTRSFAPLKASRGYFRAKSVNGNVIITGNVRTPQARRVLLDNIPHIRGVIGCDGSALYDDEMIRFAVGQILAPGLSASVHYGSVVIMGSLPDGTSIETIAQAVMAIPGVRRVATDFGVPVVIMPAPENIEPAQ
jgi:osmotically-inducible protein OsmY